MRLKSILFVKLVVFAGTVVFFYFCCFLLLLSLIFPMSMTFLLSLIIQ